MLRRASLVAIFLAVCQAAPAQNQKKDYSRQWTKAEAAAWYKDQPWIVGCNYIPSTAVNQLEMWQKDTFDPKTIDRELGWAAELGFTSVRVYLHDLLWEQDRDGFVDRMHEFLALARKHKIRVMFVLFDSCWNPAPKLGKQPAPIPHLHNSGWVQAPGVAVLKDPEQWKKKEGYVKGLISSFRSDRRVLAWDLWNEPENNNASSYGKLDIKDKEKVVLPLVKQVFAWARAAAPTQPITAAPWAGDWSDDAKLGPLNRFLFENSDIITFHRYENLKRTRASAEALKRFGRPILCTEYMARPIGSRFETHLPYFHQEKIGAFCWGFVSGKSQTIYPWDSWQKKYNAEPKVWFHDILRANGKPYDPKETLLIRRLADRAIDVQLRFSVDVLDPLKPGKSYVECIVRNDTEKAVHVPTIYSGGYQSDMILTTGSYRNLHLVVWAGTKMKVTQLLKPGERMTIFKDSLNDVFLLDHDRPKPLKPKEKRYYWSWSA